MDQQNGGDIMIVIYSMFIKDKNWNEEILRGSL